MDETGGVVGQALPTHASVNRITCILSCPFLIPLLHTCATYVMLHTCATYVLLYTCATYILLHTCATYVHFCLAHAPSTLTLCNNARSVTNPSPQFAIEPLCTYTGRDEGDVCRPQGMATFCAYEATEHSIMKACSMRQTSPALCLEC